MPGTRFVYADLHTTDGADFQANISVQVEPVLGGRRRCSRSAGSCATAAGGPDGSRRHSAALLPSFVQNDDPTSGFGDGRRAAPLFGTPTGRCETASGCWSRHTRGELRGTGGQHPHDAGSLLTRTAAAGTRWLAAAHRPMPPRAAAAASPAGRLSDESGGDPDRLSGYAYVVAPSDISGAQMITYDPSNKMVWRVPLRDKVVVKTTVEAPKGGYLIPPQEAALLVERLRAHGIDFTIVSKRN